MSNIVKYAFIFLLFIGCYTSTLAHEFYLSICEIEHNVETQSLQITIKIFTDDLERALEDNGAGKLFLGTEKEGEKTDEFLFTYLKEKLMIEVDDEDMNFIYIGKEVEIDATWCYVEVENVPNLNNISVENRLLLDSFQTQTNIVHVKYAGKLQSQILRREQDLGEFKF